MDLIGEGTRSSKSLQIFCLWMLHLMLLQTIINKFSILCYDEAYAEWFPCVFAFMTSKSAKAYEHIFNFLLDHCCERQNNIQLKWVICDFEKSLHQSVAKKLKARIIGCYFHLMKAMWSKAAKYG